MIRRATLLGVAAAAVTLLQAQAQTSPRVVNPNRADQNAPGRSVTPGKRLAAPRLPAQARNPDTPITPFSLQRVEVTGSSLPTSSLEPAYAAMIGQTVDNAALNRITDALAKVYDRSDIALYTVFVPVQDFANGTLKLLAVEGHIQTAEVHGRIPRKEKALLREYLGRLQAGRPLKTSALQRYVSLIRDIPGLYPQLEFQPGSEQGGVKLVLDLKPKRIQASVGISNRGTAFLGQTQMQGDLYLNSIARGGDQLRATVVLPTEPRLFQYYALNYAVPLDGSGTTAQISTGYLRTRPTLIPLAGDAVTLGVQITRPLIRGYTKNLFLTLGIDGVNSNSALFASTLSDDHVRAARVAMSFNTSNSRNALTVNGSVSRGVNIFGERVFDTRASKPDFTKATVKVIDNFQIVPKWILRLDAFGQFSRDPLPSSEQIALGGDEFGRAYEAAIIAGDSGMAGSAELAYRPERLPKVLSGSEAYVFTDGGRVWLYDRFGFGSSRSDLGSVGGGVRAQIANRSIIQLEAARGLTNPVFYEDRQSWRLLVSARTIF